MSTHSLAEWAGFLSLGLSISSAVSIPFWLTYDADLADFDPRPAVRRAVESGRYDAALVTVANARHDAYAMAARTRQAAARAAITTAALLALLTAKGTLR